MRRTKAQLEKDMNLFKVIDSEVKAYLLGFLYADGSVYKTNVRLVLHKRDDVIVKKLAQLLNMEESIRYRDNYIILGIKSKILSEALREMGCVENKSLKLNFPSSNIVPLVYINHFIRGYFDGDGCAHIQKNGTLICQMVGTMKFLKGIKSILKTCNIKTYIYSPKQHKVSTLRISTSDNFKFKSFLYNKASIYLNRKYQKFETRKQYMLLKGKRNLKQII